MSLESRFWMKVDRRGPDECWIWLGARNEHGYGVMRPEGKRTGPCIRAHRVSAALAGMEVEGKVVRHACDNPPCVNPAHLSPGSTRDNIDDMLARGRSNRGAKNGQAKLDAERVAEMRKDRAAGMSYDDLVRKYGVAKSTASRVITRKGWA